MPAQPKSKPDLDEGQRQAGLVVQARRHEMGRASAVPGEGHRGRSCSPTPTSRSSAG